MKRKIIEWENCHGCGGTGGIRIVRWASASEPCLVCRGQGRVVKKEEIIEE